MHPSVSATHVFAAALGKSCKPH